MLRWVEFGLSQTISSSLSLSLSLSLYFSPSIHLRPSPRSRTHAYLHQIWDARSGRLLRIYRDLCKSEITALCIDDRQRKFITGDHDGNIVVYSYNNGARMKDLISHGGEVSGLQYSPTGNKHVISISWDGSLLIQDESDPERGTLVLRVFHMDGVMQSQDRTPRHLRVKAGAVEWSGLGVGGSSGSSRHAHRSTSSYTLTGGSSSSGSGGGGGNGDGYGNAGGGDGSSGGGEAASSEPHPPQQRLRSVRSMRKPSMAANRWGSTPSMTPGSMPGAGPIPSQKVEVNAFALSHNLALFVTGGGSDKSICVWDKESGKPDGVCLGHTAEVNALIFLDPYPVGLAGRCSCLCTQPLATINLIISASSSPPPIKQTQNRRHSSRQMWQGTSACGRHDRRTSSTTASCASRTPTPRETRSRSRLWHGTIPPRCSSRATRRDGSRRGSSEELS